VRHPAPPKQGLQYLPVATVLPNRKLMKNGSLDLVMEPRCAGNFVSFAKAFWHTKCLDATYRMFPTTRTRIGRFALALWIISSQNRCSYSEN
jgi:hypothetical protein